MSAEAGCQVTDCPRVAVATTTQTTTDGCGAVILTCLLDAHRLVRDGQADPTIKSVEITYLREAS